jgi:hypothetical protein
MTECALCQLAKTQVVGEYRMTQRCCRRRFLLREPKVACRRAWLEIWSERYGPDESEATRADVVAAWASR